MSSFIEDPFAAVDVALANLGRFLDASALDCTPILLTHPPSRRAERMTALKAIHTAFDSYQEKMDAIGRRHAELKTRLTRQRAMYASALAPISAMPPELVEEIFSIVSTQDMYTRPDKYPHIGSCLAQVCSEWREIALRKKDLWLSINVSKAASGDAIDMFLSRSGSLPFHLQIDRDQRLLLSKADPFSSRLLQSRLTHLDWNTSRHFDHLQSPFDYHTKFPFLHTLVIRGGDECSTCNHLNDYDGPVNGPELGRDLPGIFPILSTLHLSQVYYTVPPLSSPKVEALEDRDMSNDPPNLPTVV